MQSSPLRPLPARILILVPSLSVGGAERVVCTLVTRMDSARFSPTVVCINEEGEFFDEVVDAGIPAVALNLSGKTNALRTLLRITSIVREGRFDVIIMYSLQAEFFGKIAARLAGVKNTVLWIHSIAPEAAPVLQVKKGIRIPVQKVVRFLLSKLESTRYFGVADAQRKYMEGVLGYPSDRIRIIHNGVDSRRFSGERDRKALAEFGIADDSAVVSIVARLAKEKDHNTLLHAAQTLLAEFPRIHFLIIGDGPQRPRLVELAADLGLTDHVHFTGTRLDIGPLLHATDVFVLASHNESFPMAVLEAMSCGLPVVGTDIGGMSEMIDDNVTGFLVEPENHMQLSAKIRALLLDAELARSVGQNARRRIEEDFRLDDSVEATQEAIAEMLRSEHRY